MLRFTAIAVTLLLFSVGSFGQQAKQPALDVTPEVTAEDWTNLSAAQAGLESLPPMPGGKDERATFTRELVRVQWRPGDPIDLYIVKPKGVEKPRVILYLYSYVNDSTRFRNDEWCKNVVEKGFAAVGFVSALSGERYRGRSMKQWFVSELPESLGSTTHDIQKIIDYLGERGDLNLKQVAMYGQGSGATIAILAASVDSRIAVLDLLNPWGEWKSWLKESALVPENERSAYLRPDFLSQLEKLDPVSILPKLKTQAVRLQQVADDLGTPASARLRIASAVANSNAVVQYKDLKSLRKAWEQETAWSWIKSQLQPKPTEMVKDDTRSQPSNPSLASARE